MYNIIVKIVIILSHKDSFFVVIVTRIGGNLMKALKKYCLPSRKRFYFLSIIIYIFSFIAGMIAVAAEDDFDEDEMVPAMIMLIIILTVIWIFAHHYTITVPRKRFKRRLKYFERQGVLQYALSDIQRGVTKFNGRVLLGQYCIMGKGTGLIVFYKEIGSMYVKIDRTTDDDGNTTESWSLKIDAGGKTYNICSVNKNADSIRDWNEICMFIRLKAPNIILK